MVDCKCGHFKSEHYNISGYCGIDKCTCKKFAIDLKQLDPRAIYTIGGIKISFVGDQDDGQWRLRFEPSDGSTVVTINIDFEDAFSIIKNSHPIIYRRES